MLSNCGHDENGKYSGGAAGDQTGTEWQIIKWYNRPWKCVLRHPDENVRALIATLAKDAEENSNIGYDQSERGTFWTALAKAKYLPANVAVKCEADCSSGVIAIVKAVGHLLGMKALQNISATYTGNMRSGFTAAGFMAITGAEYLTSDAYLLPGDILLNDGTHTATNLTAGSKSGLALKSTEAVAKEVLAGKWLNNPTRANALTIAGYDAKAVQDVVNTLAGKTAANDAETTPNRPATATADPAAVWEFLLKLTGNAYGAAGLMGNLYAESALLPCNLQNSYEKKLEYTDATYTADVDSSKYANWEKDSAGYGLAQWTFWTRKRGLLAYAKSVDSSVGNLTTQLEYLAVELSGGYSAVLAALKSAQSVREASDAVLTKFERPADQSDRVKETRAGYGEKFLAQYGKAVTPAEPVIPSTVKYGATGDDVKKLQTKLTAAGYKTDADGEYGIETFGNVARFQAKNKLSVDGICAESTWKLLLK